MMFYKHTVLLPVVALLCGSQLLWLSAVSAQLQWRGGTPQDQQRRRRLWVLSQRGTTRYGAVPNERFRTSTAADANGSVIAVGGRVSSVHIPMIDPITSKEGPTRRAPTT